MKSKTKIYLGVLIVVVTGLVTYIANRFKSNKQQDRMQTVSSKDGTTIVYEVTGNGPAVVLITGALATHADHTNVAKLLSSHFTVYNYDRRGRGQSGDHLPYSVEREIEDIEALIDAAGGSVYLYGVSSGACLALETAAALSDKVRKIAVYEAPYDEAENAAQPWKQYSVKLDQLLAEDRVGEAVELHFTFVGVPASAIALLKLSPKWSTFKTLAPTIAYDVRVIGEDRSIPLQRFASIPAAALIMDGAKSLEAMPYMSRTADTLAKTIPHARRRTLEGQDHTVDDKIVVSAVEEFFLKDI